jgi:class 3 adenylate cyclase
MWSVIAGSPGQTRRELARLRAVRSELIDPAIAVHHGRVVKRTGDGITIEFRSVVDAVRCAIEVQTGMVERSVGLPPERRMEFRVGIHLGDVVEEADGDLMGEGVNIAARLEGIAKPGAICLPEQAYWQVKGRLDLAVTDLGSTSLRTSPSRSAFIRSKSASRRSPSLSRPQRLKKPPRRASRWWFYRSPISAAARSRNISSTELRRASQPTSHGYEGPS